MSAFISSRNHRTSVRANTDFPMTAHVDGHERQYRAIDLSCGGALVRRASDRKPPMFHRVALDLGGKEPVSFMARTVWSDDQRHAVRFVDMHDVDRLEIAEMLDRLALRP